MTKIWFRSLDNISSDRIASILKSAKHCIRPMVRCEVSFALRMNPLSVATPGPSPLLVDPLLPWGRRMR
jgi:hypothetical protein